MNRFFGVQTTFRWGACASALLIAAVATAAGPGRGGARTNNADPEVKPESVEFFSAIEKGQIQVRLTPRNADLCRLVVRNTTDTPLSVKLPEALGGAPVLAQQSGRQSNSQATLWPGLPTGPRGGRSAVAGPARSGDPARTELARSGDPARTDSQAGSAPVGNPGRTQALGMAPPPGLFPPNSASAYLDVPAEGVGQVMLCSICLERAKPGPTARTPYEVKPLSQITDKPAVFELCRMLSRGDVNPRMVQAAAWHVNNNLEWRRLLRHGNVSLLADAARFTQAELFGAQRLVTIAEQAAAERAETAAASSRSEVSTR